MKINTAWERLFQDHAIVSKINQDGFFRISSKEMKVYYEPRLMTKFDHSVNLPAIFQQHKLSLQPDSRASVIIAPMESYQELPAATSSIISLPFPDHIETINPERITSESAAILAAYYAGIFSTAFEEDKIAFTVYGRMGTGQFHFNINNVLAGAPPLGISVSNSQCEIDAGLEGENVFAIVEAKNQLPQDFLIRQLYYPYRVWEKRTRKPIVPIFLTYANDVFTLNIGRFGQLDAYNSFEIISQQRFSLVARSIELNDVEEIWKTARLLPEPAAPTFPQADSFLRVLDLMTQLANAADAVSQQDLTEFYDFSTRQTAYYTDAASYLGFVEKTTSEENKVAYQLTRLGKTVMSHSARARNLAIVKQVLRFPVFHRALGAYFQNHQRPTKDEIVRIMREAKLKKLGEGKTTVPRRAQTVLSWLDWMLELTTA